MTQQQDPEEAKVGPLDQDIQVPLGSIIIELTMIFPSDQAAILEGLARADNLDAHDWVAAKFERLIRSEIRPHPPHARG